MGNAISMMSLSVNARRFWSNLINAAHNAVPLLPCAKIVKTVMVIAIV
jgi:hypothetical protein